MSKFRRINVHRSSNRVLLTEVSPFELPPNLINVGFFRHVRESQTELDNGTLSWVDRANAADSYLALLNSGVDEHSLIVGPTNGRLSLDMSKSSWKIPYRFFVRKSDGQKRTMSLPHPATQLGVVAFYKENSDALVFHTSRSHFSLRHPSQVARFSFAEDKSHRDRRSRRRSGIETTKDELESLASFFRYRRYSNINKFYESQEFHRLEARFPFQRRLDITRCFESLYTHSIDWAVRGHHASKHGIGHDLFSTRLDKLFQSANHGQTNGVIVGPEFSRIFAEIILQCADLEIQSELAGRGLVFGHDYWVGRYVDDYFIFCADAVTANSIQNEIETQLEKFNLRLNRSKQVDFIGPSFSPIHTAKQRIARQLSTYFKRAEEYVAGSGSTKRAPDINRVISGYKSVLHALEVTPAEVNNFTLGIIEKRVFRMERELVASSRKSAEALSGVLRDATVLVEFLYLAAPSVPGALRSTRILLQHVRLSKKVHLDRDLRLSVLSEIDRSCVAILDRHSSEVPEGAGAERFYWLLLHAELGRPLLLTEDELRRLVMRTSPDYLLIVTVLLYMRRRHRYAALRTEICELIEGVVAGLHPDSAERVMLQADVIACPYIDPCYKLAWLSTWFPSETKASHQAAISDWPASIYAAWGSFDLEQALWAKKRREVY